ncbi:MAG: hypothetical protein GY862_36865 [Gammaproteobacteria bacterium]|nr:hypothetical protein [Gammaproteobacteria bacterium]
MKKANKLIAAAIAAAASLSPAALQAEIKLKPDGFGDALIFPFFHGPAENYFTISSISDKFVQGHIRFRGALWGSGLLDFDVILAPFDVFVFRLADLDGDGQWEIDQSIDPDHFAYTSLTGSCHGAFPADNCMEQDDAREPTILPQSHIDYNHNFGYMEFIGEAVLDGMTKAEMSALLTAGSDLSAIGLSEAHRSGTGTGLGTNAWRWSTAGSVDNVPPYPDDRGLSDFPNIVSGTAFITIPGQSSGLAYNAEALADFRTPTVASGDLAADVSHRIDNYTRTVSARTAVHPVTGVQASTASLDGAVILHHEDAAAPDGRYIYRLADIIGYESMISWQNTRGPTMADGDDYYIAGSDVWSLGNDDYDSFYHVPNSIAEVEEAIRAGGQKTFASFYFDSNALPGAAAAITSWFFALFPTMHHAVAYGGGDGYLGASNPGAFLDAMVYYLTDRAEKLINDVGVCDINATCGITPSGTGGVGGALVEPAYVSSLARELSFFDIRFLKWRLSGVDIRSGRVRLFFDDKYSLWDGPGFFYTFEVTSDGKLAHWRRMQRGH